MASMMMMPMACDKALDINVNPLTASVANPNAVLPFVLVQFDNRNTTELGTRSCDVYQHTAATFNSPRRGNTSTTQTGNTWNMLYTQVLSNLDLMEKDARLAGETSNNIVAVALTMKAIAFFEATTIWDKIPFTQALNAKDFPFPEFDTQEVVLKGTVAMLEEAVAAIDAMPATGNFDLSPGDLIYEGDMSLWRKFANSVKLRILMIIRNKDAAYADPKIATLLSTAGSLIETNDEAALFRYPGTVGNQNAWKQIVTAFGTGSNEDTNYFGPSPVIRGLLTGDPRLALWCVDGTNGNFEARPIGQFPGFAHARYSDNVIRGDLPSIWYLPAEVSFYRAELIVKGVISGDANSFYRQGVTEVLEFWGQDIPGAQKTLSNTEISTFVSGLADINGMTTTNALTAIGNQQYLETFWRPMEGWNHVRRTKVPNIGAAPGATISTMLKRFNYPPDESGSNPNTPPNLLTDVPQWFEN